MVLMMELSYLQNRYDVLENKQGYQFTTMAGVDYLLTFISYPAVSDFLSTDIYMFNIERVSNNEISNVGQDDVRVRNTILYVLDVFFQSHKEALITICEMIDGKQFARKRLFDSWFREFNQNRLIKLEADCLIDDVPTFVSLFFSAEHSDQNGLRDAFQELIKINFYN